MLHCCKSRLTCAAFWRCIYRAVFPMQTLGLEVDFVNTVQFSNHTGYESFTGTALEGNAL